MTSVAVRSTYFCPIAVNDSLSSRPSVLSCVNVDVTLVDVSQFVRGQFDARMYGLIFDSTIRHDVSNRRLVSVNVPIHAVLDVLDAASASHSMQHRDSKIHPQRSLWF